MITERVIFYKRPKLNVVTTYLIDLFSKGVIIGACTSEKPPVSKMGNLITIGHW